MSMNMPLGMIALLIVGVLVYFGIAQRLLDRMRLTDRQAILFIFAMAAGSFLEIPIVRGNVNVTLNVGGALVPALLCLWLFFKAGTTKERLRALLATLLVAGAIFLGSRYLPYEPETMFLDPKLLYGISAGIIAYLAGRSRRSAFIGGVMGVILSDIIHLVVLLSRGIIGTTALGGAGVFDVTVMSGLVAIMTAELVGETREKLQGGPDLSPGRPAGLYEFSKELGVSENEVKKEGSVISLESRKKMSSAKKTGGEKNE